MTWYVEGINKRMTFAQQFSVAQGSWQAPDNSIVEGNQYFVVVTYDSSSDLNDPVMYVNGQSVAVSEGLIPSGSANSNTDPYVLGNRGNQDRTFDGWMDEVRVSSVARTADWIATEYNNQYSPSAFYNIGPEQTATISPAGKTIGIN